MLRGSLNWEVEFLLSLLKKITNLGRRQWDTVGVKRNSLALLQRMREREKEREVLTWLMYYIFCVVCVNCEVEGGQQRIWENRENSI